MSRTNAFRPFPSALLLMAAAAPAIGGQLLFSFDRIEGTGVSPLSPQRPVEIVLSEQSPTDYFDFVDLGRGTLWDDGESGTVDFASVTHSDFDDFARRVANGVDDLVSVLVAWPNRGGGGGTALESQWGFGPPDLVGNEIDLIRLIVHDVQIEPWEDGYFAEVDVTYEFYGTPIPEPATAILLALGASAILGRTSRRKVIQFPGVGRSPT